MSSTGQLPGGLQAGVDYWLVRVSASDVTVATSSQNALATPPVVVDITDAGSGTHTLTVGMPQLGTPTWAISRSAGIR